MYYHIIINSDNRKAVIFLKVIPEALFINHRFQSSTRIGVAVRRWTQKPELQKHLPEVFYKNVLLKIFQNSQENTWARVSLLIKFQTKGLQLY